MEFKTKLVFLYKAGYFYLNVYEPPNPRDYKYLKLDDEYFELVYVDENRYSYKDKKPQRNIGTYETVILTDTNYNSSYGIEWISRSRTEYQNYPTRSEVDYSRYEDESGSTGGVRGEIRITWEEKFINGFSTGEKRNEKREIIRQMQPLIRWTGGRKRGGNSNIPSSGKVKWFRHKITYTDGTVSYGTPWRDGTVLNQDELLKDLNLARTEFKTFKEETEKHFSQTVKLDKYNQFNQLYQQEQSELRQTVNSLSSKMTYAEYDLKKYSSLSQTVDGLKTEVAKIDGLNKQYTSLSQTVDGMKSTVYKANDNAYKISQLSQTVDGITSIVGDNAYDFDKKISSVIEQKANSITLGIGQVSGLNSKIDKLETKIQANADGLKTEVAKIDGLNKKYTSLSQTVDSLGSLVYETDQNTTRISELKQTVNSINTSISYLQDGIRKYSSLSQTVDGLKTEVAKIDGLNKQYTSLSQTVDGMKSTVYKASDNAYKISQLSQTVDSITSIVGDSSYDFNRKISSVIEQKANSITLGVGQVNGLNDKLNSLSSSIQVAEKKIAAKANNIDLQGKVSFSHLNSEGNDNRDYTFIDGGKIMTDTIGARQIKAYAITADHLVVNEAMINKLIANKLLAKKISASDAIITRIKATDISASNITAGVLSSRSGGSWIDLDEGKFSFYNNALFIDENTKDINGGYSRTRLHTTGTFRVSYRGNPSVELNSGGITLFKDKEDQDSKGTNKIQSNGNGNLQISSINSSGNANVNVEIGAKNGYVMYVYGSLYVGRNLMVDREIRYGISCQKGTSF